MGGGGAYSAAIRGAAEGQYVKAKTSVWWDIENCCVPRLCDPHMIAQNISSALAAMDYSGAVTISAYGDTSRINSAVQQALSSTGISLNHVPAGVKDASDKKILVDMLFWAVDNPPPANYLLISGDRDFSNALHQLRMRRYNILLAQPADVSQALVSAAKSVWLWTNLVIGGPPLPETVPIHNASSGSWSTVETPSSKPESTQLADSTQKNNGNEKADNLNKGTQSQRGQNQPNTNIPRTSSSTSIGSQGKGTQSQRGQNQPNTNIPRTSSSTSIGSQGKQSKGSSNATNPKLAKGLKQPNNASNPKKSGSGAQDCANMNNNKPSSSKSHKLNTSDGPSSTNAQPHLDKPKNKGTSFPNPPQTQYAPPPSRPSDSCPQMNVPFGTSSESNPGLNSYSPASGTYGPSYSTAPNAQPHPDKPKNKGTNFPNPPQTQYPPPPRPSDFCPQMNVPFGTSSESNPGLNSYSPALGTYGPSYSTTPSTMPNGFPPFTAFPPPSTFPRGPPLTSSPDISRLNISGYPNGELQSTMSPFYHNMNGSTAPMDSNKSNNGGWGNLGCPMPSNHVQGLIGFILGALHTLKAEKLAPTESNIADCIRYGEFNIQNFDVRMALDHAIGHQVVVVHKLGNNLPLYLGKNDTLWKCINIVDINAKHPDSKYDAVQKYLSSADGRAAILASQCRYQAGIVLKKSCLKDLNLGKILRILHVVTHVRKWIVPHASGWQPLCLAVSSDSDASVDASTSP